ncbi:hypothetical protein L6452_18245 [Arctium lappa]|uniref:Uncharacterized protein n=1 Tax=Arctium lappa TaxID=4217 RepID=A0ACB9C5L3_ARCLA|nr:hypothetical protein L6452_18245 [Arctium lappa]
MKVMLMVLLLLFLMCLSESTVCFLTRLRCKADVGTEKSRWAVEEKKFLIEPRWLEAANFRWQRQPDEKFPVKEKLRISI